MTSQTTEYHGVFVRKSGGFSAYVCVKAYRWRRQFVGVFNDAESAARAVNAKLIELGEEPRNMVKPGPIRASAKSRRSGRVVSNTVAALKDFRRYAAMKEFSEELAPLIAHLEQQIEAEKRKKEKGSL